VNRRERYYGEWLWKDKRERQRQRERVDEKGQKEKLVGRTMNCNTIKEGKDGGKIVIRK
jgi:hypothetical protein